ncbi:MAG: hypothetical protein E4H07_08255 [Nitrosomonadales bacterium]|nr:MAG: hypothetical protein E4H07_08255 [Nitrosomonadales bacterium]
MLVAKSTIDQPPSKSGNKVLYAGGIAAIVASTCHHLSYLFVMLGLSGGTTLYIITLTEIARPFLIIVTIITLLISYQNIWGISSVHKDGSSNITSQTKITDKVFFTFIVMIMIVVLLLPYFAPCAKI